MGMEFPDTRRKADDSYRALRVGRSCFLPRCARERALMTKLPNSLLVSLWGVGVCWVAAAIAYLTDSVTLPVVPLLVSLVVLLLVPLLLIGILGGMAEWPQGRQKH